jgi:anti-sigma regulatory factor (Ser/Thr protein kinase)
MLTDCPTPRSPRPTDSLIHQALPYRTTDQFLAAAVPFLSNGAAADDLVLCVTSAANLAQLRDRLPADALAKISLTDSRDWYRNPVQALGDAYRIVDQNAMLGRRVRFWGEPLAQDPDTRDDGHPGGTRSAWMRYEAQVNVVMAGHPAWIICPYDIARLGPQVLDGVTRTHPMITTPNRAWLGAYDERRWFHPARRTGLDQPARVLHLQVVTTEILAAARDAIRGHADAAGLGRPAVDRFVLAVNEAMSNAIEHAGGLGVLRLWLDPVHLVCEVTDYGPGLARDPGERLGPDTDRARDGFGSRVITGCCADVQVVAGSDGTVIRLRSDREPPGGP